MIIKRNRSLAYPILDVFCTFKLTVSVKPACSQVSCISGLPFVPALDKIVQTRLVKSCFGNLRPIEMFKKKCTLHNLRGKVIHKLYLT